MTVLGRSVLIVADRHDTLIPHASTERLAGALQKAGAAGA